MAEARTRGQLCKLKSSGKEWAHLTKFEVLGIVDFWQFCKNAQLQQFITLSIFGHFEWFKSQNVIQDVYFMPSFLVKRKIQVEAHVWMQDIIGHF